MICRPFARLFALIALVLLLAAPVLAQDPTPTPEPLPVCTAFENQPDEQRLAYYMGEGWAYRSANRLDEARNAFSCVIRVIDDGYVPAYMGRGEVFLQMRLLERAVEDFTRAGQLDGSIPQPANNRGVAYALLGDIPRAQADFERALSIDAAHLPAVNNLALMQAMNGDFEEAIALVEAAIDQSGVDMQLADLTNPERADDAPALAVDEAEAALYGLLGTLRSAQALADYRAYLFLFNYAGHNMDERIAAAASALENRFTFDFRLDDGSLLQISDYPINAG